MDPIFATYMMLFLGVFALDVGVFDSSTNTSADEDTVPGDGGTDTVDGGDSGNDTVDGGGNGNDTVDGGNDTVTGDDGALYDADSYTREVFGTEVDDSLSAEEELDLAFFLGEGNDLLDASEGADYAESGAGDDTVSMREGNDIVLGGAGNDLIDAGTGFDMAFGEAGEDTILGNGGNDLLSGGVDNDLLSGGTGADELFGGDGDDTIHGLSEGLSSQSGATVIDGVDTLAGGAGNDTLFLGPGDIGIGGEGEDIFQLDQTRTDLADVSRITDYQAGDRLEIHYTPTFNQNGTEDPVVLNLVANAGDTGQIITMNGRPIADVIGGQTLRLADLVLVRT